MSLAAKIIMVIIGLLLLIPGVCGAVFLVAGFEDIIKGGSGQKLDFTPLILIMGPLGLICGGFGIWMILKVIRASRPDPNPSPRDGTP